MKLLNYLIICSLLILAIFTAGCTDMLESNESNQNIENITELTLTVIPEKTELEYGESFNINLTLTNVGNNTLNVWRMEHPISYDISFELLVDNSSAEWICGASSIPAPTYGYLAELKPGESLNSTFNSDCWILNPGEYRLSAIYHTGYTQSDGSTSKPYWRGSVKSNEVLIKVRDTQNNLTESPQIRK